MSVLYKALQKAEKENEQRQGAAGGLDTDKLVGSGAIKLAGGRGVNWRVTGLAAAVVLAVAIGAAFFLVDTTPPPPRQVAAMPTAKPPAQSGQVPVLQPPAAATPAPESAPAAAQPAAATPAPAAQPADVTPQSAAATASPAPAAQPAPMPAPAPAPAQVAVAPAQSPAEAPAAVAPVKPTVVAKAEAPAPKVVSAPKPPTREAPPEIPADSPTRMLSPPVSINRAEFALSGVGKAVQVREVSREAQDNVGAAYSALLRGEYDTALGFYDRALQKEPTSVLALMGRGAALQRLHRAEEAQASYDRVLKIDPNNREALTNITSLVAERSPGEALNRLLELEKDNPSFSPIKAAIGLTYAKSGTMDQALEYLRRAVTLNPDSALYQYNLAVVLDHMGLRDQAIATYESVLNALAGGRGTAELSSMEIERRVTFLRIR